MFTYIMSKTINEQIYQNKKAIFCMSVMQLDELQMFKSICLETELKLSVEMV